MKDNKLLSILEGVYKAGYKLAIREDSEIEEDDSPRLPYL